MKKYVLSLMMGLMLASFANADLMIDGTWTHGSGVLSNTASAANVGGTDVVLNDSLVHTSGTSWLSGLFYCELSAGSLYQNDSVPSMPWGHDNDVDSWLVDYVTVFSHANELASQGGMSGNPANAAASITFIAELPSDPVPPWDGQSSRFAFTVDSQGLWAYKVSVGGSTPVIVTGLIQDGVMVVPEPGTIAMLLCGLAGLFVLRRK